jgi:threonine dehydrogenase-like Zn-dependent dehydrogenase
VRGLLLTQPGEYAVRELAEPVAGPGEVLVAPAAVGICGSDIELLRGQRPAAYVRYPVVPGHEWVGTVVSCGPGETFLAAGTPVVAEGVRSCGECQRCAEGRTNLCTGPYAETGFTHAGALAQLVVVPTRQVHVLPLGRLSATAVLIEPAACVATGLMEVGAPLAGARVAVVGDGPLGLLAVALLRLSGPADLLLLGTHPERADRVRALGASDVIMRDAPAPALPHLRGLFDLVVEATNSPEGASTALALSRRAGTVILLGISGAGRPAIDPDTITLGHLRVQGVFSASRAAWHWLVDLYAGGQFDPGELITHTFALDEVDEAFAVLGDRSAGALKVVVQPN